MLNLTPEMTSQQSVKKLSHKVAVVTGASRGIGRAIAKRLTRDGAMVVINYAHSVQQAQELGEEIGQQALIVRADVSQAPEITMLFDKAIERFGKIDIVVNNAGILELSPLQSIEEEHYQRMFDVNVRGALFAIKAAAERMGEGGRIINISSVLSTRACPYGAVYAATKAAIDSFTRTFAAELGSRRITVNAVAPGLTESDMKNQTPPEFHAHEMQSTVLGRLGTPEDIADAVAFLASDDSRWSTGQVIGVDGGYLG